MVDNLTLTYNGNRLKNVHDAAVSVAWSESSDFKDYSKDSNQTKVEYSYNLNGSMNKDLNKGISSIEYNSLNLPRVITIANASHQGTIRYTYSASGAKLRTVHTPNLALYNSPLMGTVDYAADALTKAKTTDYVGNKVYENGSLKRILVDGGYYDAEAKNYHFYLTDHLGNNRVVADRIGKVEQITHYYPFGMTFAEGKNSGLQSYKYNGKELDKELGLEIYDYVARQRDQQLAQFMSIDPLAERYYSWSPYAYVMNNPMKYIDTDGKQTRIPLSMFGNPSQLRSTVTQMKAEKIAGDALDPVGVGLTVGGSVSGGVEVGGSYSVAYLTDGIDAGTVNSYAKGNVGAGMPGGSINFSIDLIYANGDKSNFTAQSLEGGSTETSVSAAKGNGVGTITYSKGDENTNLQISTIGVGAGLGYSPIATPVSASLTRARTTQLTGSQDTQAKRDKLNHQKEQKREESKESSMFSSFWDWMIKY